jgi:competence protein CoiA
MLSAYSNEKEIVTLLHRSRKEIQQLKEQPFFCPICGSPVQIKNGKVKIPHFFHTYQNACDSTSKGETQEHLALKKMFVAWCEREGRNYELEKYLPSLNQRPDLLIGKRAVEIQCSPLSVSRLIERNNVYQDHEYQPIWICGKKLVNGLKSLNELIKHLCNYSQNLGFYLWSADWQTKEVTLYFHIEEDWKKRVYAACRTWSTDTASLAEIFKFPTEALIYHQRKYQHGQLISDYYTELNRKLIKKEGQLRVVQEVLYNNHLHVLQLPYWFYYPGIHLFCCRGSDLLLKERIWKWVQFFDQNVFRPKELESSLKSQIAKSAELFYEFPTIPFAQLQDYCFAQLFNQLVDCHHLIRTTTGWKVNAGKSVQSMVEVNKWLKRIKNRRLNSATPYRSMIL